MVYIQKLMYRPQEMSTAEKMYISGNQYFYLKEEEALFIKKNGKVDTGTYFNSFSMEKWRKYTNLSDLFLRFKVKGEFTISIINHWLTAGDYLEKCLYEEYVSEANISEKMIDLSEFLDKCGIICFRIDAHEDCIFSDVAYMTKKNFPMKKLALAICTYKREKYIYKLINDSEKYSGAESLGLFIADNGKSLKKVKNGNVRIFSNKNAGGAAGFARCMLEIARYNKYSQSVYDYIVLMDDDINLDFHIFDRLISFVSLLRKEFHSHFIAGSMCSLDYPYLQYERYSSWRGGGIFPSLELIRI